jgi:hypothetical protein
MTVTATVSAPAVAPTSWLSNLAAPLIEIGQAILNALASFNWSALFPNFGGLAAALVSLLQTALGIAQTKVAPSTAVAS